jgi:hypothetical protein
LLGVAQSARAEVDVKSIAGKQYKPYRPGILLTRPLPAAEQERLLQKIAVIRDELRRTPALNELRGYDWQFYASIKNGASLDGPVVGALGYVLHAYVERRDGKVEPSLEGPPLKIHLNDPQQMLLNALHDVDAEARFASEPRQTGELDGFPVYNDEFVFISKRGEPPFVPVSQERYLTRRIAVSKAELKEMAARFKQSPEDPLANQREIEEGLAAIKAARAEAETRWAAMGKWPDRVKAERERFDARERKQLAEIEALRTSTPRQRFLRPFEERLAALEAELASLSGEQRAAAARLPNGARIVTLNPNLYDGSKPQSAIQNIVIGSPRYLPEVYRQVQRQLDKQALLALMD